ncbi:MAG: serine hydrolase [Burkholderiales bacterium]|nr:serine hydrolase [Burkholderiales bacterium]
MLGSAAALLGQHAFASNDTGLTGADNAVLNAVLNAFVKSQRFHCVVMLGRRGKVTYARAFGIANIEEQRPLRVNTPFALASVSKWLTSVTVLRLLVCAVCSDSSIVVCSCMFFFAASLQLGQLQLRLFITQLGSLVAQLDAVGTGLGKIHSGDYFSQQVLGLDDGTDFDMQLLQLSRYLSANINKVLGLQTASCGNGIFNISFLHQGRQQLILVIGTTQDQNTRIPPRKNRMIAIITVTITCGRVQRLCGLMDGVLFGKGEGCFCLLSAAVRASFFAEVAAASALAKASPVATLATVVSAINKAALLVSGFVSGFVSGVFPGVFSDVFSDGVSGLLMDTP